MKNAFFAQKSTSALVDRAKTEPAGTESASTNANVILATRDTTVKLVGALPGDFTLTLRLIRDMGKASVIVQTVVAVSTMTKRN